MKATNISQSEHATPYTAMKATPALIEKRHGAPEQCEDAACHGKRNPREDHGREPG
jgi:hypothetical protein